jgi:Leucine-rich repeat (LRR) protein
MRFQRFASAFRRRLRVNSFSPAALSAMAWSPSYRAPGAADLHDEEAAQPPGLDAPLESWGARDIVVRDGEISLSMSGRAFIAAGEFFERRTIREVRLVAVQPFMDELANCSHLARLRRLDLAGARIGAAGIKLLANSPHLGGLRELGLSGNAIGEKGLAVLLESPWFDLLKVLDLGDNGLESVRLATSCLKELDLSNNPLGSDVELPNGLKRLSLSNCGAACGLAMNGDSMLTHLNVAENEIDDAGLESLANLESLEVFDLSANRLTAYGAGVIADSFPVLWDLNLTANPIGDSGALTLMRSESLGSLRRLNLTNCCLTGSGVQQLADSGTLGGLRSLSLGFNAIGDVAIGALASCPDLAGLQELDFAGTQIGFSGAIALAESPNLPSLRCIALGDNPRLTLDGLRIIQERFGTISSSGHSSPTTRQH